jgi:hypothetical protein
VSIILWFSSKLLSRQILKKTKRRKRYKSIKINLKFKNPNFTNPQKKENTAGTNRSASNENSVFLNFIWIIRTGRRSIKSISPTDGSKKTTPEKNV